jgi:broad specificity phosphatase PhoE
VPNCSISEFSYDDGIYRLVSEPQTADEYRQRQDKKITFYFVRHGETVFNAQWRMQGWCDAPLTENGIRQAEERRETLREIPFASSYASTTERTRDTASILLEPHGIAPVYDKRLREVFFGTYEGERIADRESELSRCFADMNFNEAGGESKKEIFSRLNQFFTEVTDAASDGDHILLVSHGGLYLCVMELLMGMTMKDLENIAAGKNPTPNLGYAVFTYENRTFSLKKAMSEG